MMTSNELLLGYDYDAWINGGEKIPIATDVSLKTNSHMIITGISGSGKSYFEEIVMARIAKQGGIIYFGDFKQEDAFIHLRSCPRYYPYYQAEDAINTVYSILHRRLAGDDKAREQITLIVDEYISLVLSLSTEKKRAESIMRKVSEILMLGRSMGVRIIISCQRPDASAFPSGSRLNYGICVVLGASFKSIYEMLMPQEYIDLVGERKFKVGEGVVVLQGSELRFIKTPIVRNKEHIHALCIDALTRTLSEGADGEAVEAPTSDIVLPDVRTHTSKLDEIRL